MAVYFLSLILFFFFSDFAAPQSYTISCGDGPQLAHCLPGQFFLGQLTYVSDIPLSAAEFYYLMGFKGNILVQRSQLEQGLYALHKKGIFESISLEIINPNQCSSPGGLKEYSITVRLQGVRTIRSIKTGSSAIIKKYSSYYSLNVGDCFDEAKHLLGLRNIQEQAGKHGYCNARVESNPIFNEDTKSVTIPITIQLGPLFHISACVMISNKASEQLIATIENAVRKKWQGATYHAKTEQESKDFIIKMLIKEGFLNSDIEVVPEIDQEKAIAVLRYHLHLGNRCIIQFEGNHTFSSVQLFEYIARQNGAGLLPLSLLHEELKKFYRENGFFDNSITMKQEKDQCIFIINEGIRSKIAKVVIKSNKTLDTLWIMRRFFSSCSAGHYYDQQRIHKAIERLRLYYEHQGFIHAKISHHLISSGLSDKQLHITVHEDKQYYIQSETYESANIIPEHVVPTLVGLPFYAERVTRQKQLLLDYLRAQGYLYAYVEPIFSYENQHVSIVWQINAGQRLCFGKTIVQGPSWLDISYLLPRLPYQEGAPFCMKSLEDAVDTIQALHVCDMIHICPDQNKWYEHQPILLKITPDDPFEIRARFGIAQVSNNFTFRPGTTYAVGGSFMYKNPLGHADQLRFDMDFTRFEHTTLAEYIFPLKTKLPLSGLIKVYDSVYQQPLFPGSDQSLYTVIQRGFLAGITLNYKSLTAGLNYGIEWATISNVCPVCACALDFQPSLIDTNIPSFIIEPTMLAHYENDHFNPWMSSTTLLSIKGVLPLYTRQSATGFVRFLCEQSGSVRLSPSIVFAGRVRMGHVFNQFFRAILPPERFYLGGAFSVRGYDSDLVPPLSLVNHDNCCVLVPRGGRSMINLNAELRFEVGRYMILALFQDVGALSDGIADRHWVAATGGGIRLKTPIGIVRFDVGFKWKTLKHESCCAWFLTLGNPF